MLDELEAYPGPDAPRTPSHVIAVPLRLTIPAGELAFITTVATFGTAVEITASELSIEAFFPAEAPTAEVVRGYVERLPP